MKFVLPLLMLALAGCATPALQTQAVLRSTNHPPAAKVDGVPFVMQTAGNCGPATLTMAMLWAGRKISVEELAPQVLTPNQKGSLQTDLIGASRRQGLMAIPLEGMESLLTEVAAGHPVIVFENLGYVWYPQWHYAIVLGFDLKRQELLMHSGPEAFQHQDMSQFERSWKLGDYWGLVVLPAGELAASGDDLANLRAAAGLEQVGRSTDAEQAYEQILKRWPTSVGAWIGLGNLAYQRKDFPAAVGFLRRATELHPESKMAWHNLSVATSAAQREGVGR